jgi:hypothetical protein
MPQSVEYDWVPHLPGGSAHRRIHRAKVVAMEAQVRTCSSDCRQAQQNRDGLAP